MGVDIEAVRALAAARRDVAGGLMPALHDIQDAFGHIPAASVGAIAEVFNLSRAEVHGVVTYYHHFRSEPAGRHVVQICRAEACQAMGADALLVHAEQRLGCALHASSADDRFTLEPVFCLGLCATAPAVMIDEAIHGRVDAARFDALLAGLDSERSRAVEAEVAP